jgi:hypothetical protein
MIMNIIIKDSRESTDKSLQYREFENVVGTFIDVSSGIPMRVVRFKDGSELTFPIMDRVFIEG